VQGVRLSLSGWRGHPGRCTAPRRVPLLPCRRGRHERNEGNQREKTPQLGDEFQSGQLQKVINRNR
jgi:hypothetical protein